MVKRILIRAFILLIFFGFTAFAATPAEIIGSLIDPAKLATLKGDRPANERLRRIMYHLKASGAPATTIDAAQARLGIAGTPLGLEDRAALLRNLEILEGLGCFTEEGMEKLRKGDAPTITKGAYIGDIASVDHIIPRVVVPELENKLFNLEFMPEKMNRQKAAKLGERQLELARKWLASRLISKEGFESVISSHTRPLKGPQKLETN